MAKKRVYKKTRVTTTPKPKFIPAEPKTCRRCKGDGLWHSAKTGYRARTASEPLVDPTRKCPVCNGEGKV